MADVSQLIGRGIGFSPGSTKFVPGHGLLPSTLVVVAGPFCIAAKALFVPGAVASAAYAPGSVQSAVYVPGAVAESVGCC